MKNSKIFVASIALAAALVICADAASAQSSTAQSIQTGPASTSTAKPAPPVVTRVFDAVTFRRPIPEGSQWLKAEVIHADAITLIVREEQNGYAVHTFNFSRTCSPRCRPCSTRAAFSTGTRSASSTCPDKPWRCGFTASRRSHSDRRDSISPR